MSSFSILTADIFSGWLAATRLKTSTKFFNIKYSCRFVLGVFMEKEKKTNCADLLKRVRRIELFSFAKYTEWNYAFFHLGGIKLCISTFNWNISADSTPKL
jgi:hypothetical protein